MSLEIASATLSRALQAVESRAQLQQQVNAAAATLREASESPQRAAADLVAATVDSLGQLIDTFA